MKTPTPREAAEIAAQLEQVKAAGLNTEVSMTPEQMNQFKKQLWWGRELYTGLGLGYLFPGLKSVKPIAPPVVPDGDSESLDGGFETNEPTPTGWEGHMLQDLDSGLSKALASKPDAVQHAREAAETIKQENQS